MYDHETQTQYFDTHDPNNFNHGGSLGGGGYLAAPLMGGATSSTNSMEEHMKISAFSLDDLSSSHHYTDVDVAAAYELENNFNNHLMQDMLHDPNSISMPPVLDQQNWETGVPEMQQNMSTQQQYHHPHDHQIDHHLQHNLQPFDSSPFSANSQFNAAASTPDLLNLLQLPRCSIASMLPNSSLSFSTTHKTSLDIFGEHPNIGGDNALYDPPLHLNLPPQPPIFKDLFHNLPHTYNLPPGSRGGSSFFGAGVDESGGGDGDGVYQDGDRRQYENGVLNFSRQVSGLEKGGEVKAQHFATEKHRREQLNEKFKSLRELIPNPTKNDRASIVGDATDYIKELQRTVDELKILVDKKRYGRERSKKRKIEDEGVGDMESSSMKPLTDAEHSSHTMRYSWIQRKSKDTEVDVRIIHNEVVIKLIQRKKMNCLLTVSKILDELQLDLLHVSGGNIGINYSFMFNTKIYEGSSVYAGGIANKLIEAVDKNGAFASASF